MLATRSSNHCVLLSKDDLLRFQLVPGGLGSCFLRSSGSLGPLAIWESCCVSPSLSSSSPYIPDDLVLGSGGNLPGHKMPLILSTYNGRGIHLDASGGYNNISARGTTGSGTAGSPAFVVCTSGLTALTTAYATSSITSGKKLESASDHRIKQNISSIPPTDSLNKLSLTNPTSFNFKKDHIYSDDSLQHGFMAQELKEHFPEAVTVSTGYLPIDLSSVKVTYSDPSKTILRVANLASYEINDNTKLNITNPSGDIPVTITDFDNNTNSITLDKNIPDNFVRLRFFVDNFHYVQYDKFIPITISAIKKLKSTQDELIDSIKKLTQKVELLERKHTLKRFL